MAVLLWLTILAFAALTFLGSTVTSSAAAGAGFGFVAVIVVGVLAALPVVGDWMPITLNSAAANVALGLPAGDIVAPLIGTLLTIGGSFAIAWWSFQRQEL